MKKRILCLLLVMMMGVTVLMAEENKPKIAVVAFSINDTRNSKLVNDASAVRNQVQANIVKTGQYDVIAREEIDKLLENQKIQANSISSSENIKKLKLLNISYIVTGTVDAVDNDYVVTISMLDVSNGKFTFSDEEFMSNSSQKMYTGTKTLIERFIKRLESGSDGVKVVVKKEEKKYKIGDLGPGGGIIFYVSEEGFFVYESDGTTKVCNYMETSGVIGSSIPWCTYKYGTYDICCGDISPSTGVGYGKMNTSKIINANHRQGSINASNCAAMLCYKYQTPTTKQGDWWLPSNDELNLIYTNLKCKGYISDSSCLGSSTSCGSYFCYCQSFDNGRLASVHKYCTGPVRAVRAF